MQTARVRKFFTGTPVAFPIIALFHLFWTGRGLWLYGTEPFPDPIWVQVLWLVAYTAAWIGATAGRKWSANAYIGLTVVNLLLRFLLKDPADASNLTDALFPIDLLCCFVLLVFYKRLR